MKRKSYIVLLTLLSVFLLTACSSGISKKDYEEVSSKLSSSQENNDELTSELSELKERYNSLKSDYNEIEKKCDEYEKIIEPYKDLSDAEISEKTNESKLNAKKFQNELNKIKKEEAAKKAAKLAKEKAAKAAAKLKGYNTGITYNQLARTPDKYENKKVKFTGEVIQVLEDDKTTQLRVNVNSDYDKTIFVEYDSSIVKARILEDDIITIYGVSCGLISYESTLGGTITIPSVYADKIKQ